MTALAGERPAAYASGTLAAKPLAHLLVYLLERRISGTLELTDGQGRAAQLHVRSGYPTKIRTREPVAYLSEVLLDRGDVDAALLESTQKKAYASGTLHGDVLLQAGILTTPKLTSALDEQMLRKLRYLFTLSETTSFAFYMEHDALAGYGSPNAAAHDPLPAIWRGLREATPWSHVRGALDKLGTARFTLAEDALPARFKFEGVERSVVHAFGQPRTLPEVAAAIPAPVSLVELVAYALLITRQLQVAPSASRPQIPAVSGAITLPGYQRHASLSFNVPLGAGAAGRGGGAPAMSRREIILHRAAVITSQNHFERLGVSRDAGAEDVQTAFLQLSRTFHPDHLPPDLQDLRVPCETIFNAIGEAQNVLTDSKRRAEYLTGMAMEQVAAKVQADPLAVPGARNDLDGAEICITKQQLDQAEALCRRYLKDHREDLRGVALLIYVDALKSDQDEDTLRAHIAALRSVVHRDSSVGRAFHYRGLLSQKLGDHGNALADFRRAAKLDPRNVDAAREIRLYEIRGLKGSGEREAFKKR